MILKKRRYLQFKLFVRKSNHDYDVSRIRSSVSYVIVKIYIMSLYVHTYFYISKWNTYGKN